MDGEGGGCWIYVRKSQEVSEKKPGNKLLGQNGTGNKVLSFRFLGLFTKIIRGLPIKSQEIRSQELES